MAIKKPGQVDTQINKPKGDQRVSDRIKQRLDHHIKAEFDASQIYRAMGSWCEFNGYFNAAKYFNNHAEEELTHMSKVKKYSLERNCLPVTPNVSKPEMNFADLVDVVNKAYGHEKLVTSLYEEFAKMAIEESDFTTFGFIQWFLREQIEEESSFKSMLDKVEMMKKEGMGMLEIEGEISSNSLIEG